MFGYRVRFIPEDMHMYAKTGMPSSWARQTHKPIHFYQKDRMKNVLDRYVMLDGYHSKQTVVRVLDSDDEDDLEEIERNQRAIQRQKNGSNQNPKIKKRFNNLLWHYGLESKWHQRPFSSYEGNSKSQPSIKKHRNSQQTRFTCSSIKHSHKIQSIHPIELGKHLQNSDEEENYALQNDGTNQPLINLGQANGGGPFYLIDPVGKPLRQGNIFMKLVEQQDPNKT